MVALGHGQHVFTSVLELLELDDELELELELDDEQQEQQTNVRQHNPDVTPVGMVGADVGGGPGLHPFDPFTVKHGRTKTHAAVSMLYAYTAMPSQQHGAL